MTRHSNKMSCDGRGATCRGDAGRHSVLHAVMCTHSPASAVTELDGVVVADDDGVSVLDDDGV